MEFVSISQLSAHFNSYMILYTAHQKFPPPVIISGNYTLLI